MKGKLKAANFDLTNKKITIVSRTVQIDPASPTNAVTIKTNVTEPTLIDNETDWFDFDGYASVSIGIVKRLLGESAEYGDVVVTQDELAYSFEPVTTELIVYAGYTKGQVHYVSGVTGYAGRTKGFIVYSTSVTGYGGYTKGSITV